MAVVTFTTDFGSSDGYAGAMKGVVLSLAPDGVLADIAALAVDRASLEAGGAGEVVHVDGFGNLFTSFGGAVSAGEWLLELAGRSFPVQGGRTFGDVAPGELVLYPGSGGQVEIA